MTARKWAEVTREERYFTGILFHDVLQDSKPLWNLLQRKLKFTPNVAILDVGYEVCFFRDAYHAEPKIINKRQRLLEKQTFDMVLWLSNQSLIIIEAKAQQGFKTEQLKMLCRSREIMLGLSTPDYPMTRILLVGLVSSRYKMKESTVRHFDTIIVWNEIAESYPAHTTDYNRADEIYGDKLID
jgi:hypothetical protein